MCEDDFSPIFTTNDDVEEMGAKKKVHLDIRTWVWSVHSAASRTITSLEAINNLSWTAAIRGGG